MEQMNMQENTAGGPGTDVGILAAVHGLAVVLVHDDIAALPAEQKAALNATTLREICAYDSYYKRRLESLHCDLLVATGAYSATAYRKFLERKYGKGHEDEYMSHVMTIYGELRAACGVPEK